MAIYVVLAVIMTMLVMVIVFRSLMRKVSDKKNAELLRTVSRIANERAEANAILASLPIGIIAYGSDRRLIANNDLSTKMLGDIPDSLDAFLKTYGEENGMLASFIMRAGEVSGIYERDNYIYKLTCEERRHQKANDSFVGHIITVYDVTESMRQEEKRRDFVANVSHELKTPLTTIKSYSETLLDWGIKEKDKLSIEDDVGRIYDDALRMEALIADLLLLSSIDSKAHYMKATILDAGDLTREVVDRLQASAQDKLIHMNCIVLPAKALVFADKNSLERIISNLISNAIKYTRRRGLVQVSVGNISEDIYIKVKDNGVGIAAEKLPQLFDRFYRVDKTGSRQYGGTGLGLSIAHELSEIHHGRLEVESQEGRGSAFTLFLPRADKYLLQVFFRLLNNEEVDDILGKAAVHKLSEILNDEDWQGLSKYADREQVKRIVEKIEKKVNSI